MTFDGWAGARGIDPWEFSAERLVNLIWHWATEDGDPKDVEKFKLKVWMPPRDVVPESGPWSREAELSAFKSLKNQLTG